LWGAALLSVGAFLVLAVVRLFYPFELEWLEGAILQHVERLAAGTAIYVPPSLDFTAFSYPPLYFLVAAATSRVVGGGFPALRLVSLLASLGSLALVFSIVRRSGGRTLPAAVAAGLFAATYGISGFWFDLARVDALALFLLLFGVRLLWRPGGRIAAVAAGLAFAASFLTKQTAIVCVVPIVIALAAARRRQARWLTATLLVTLVVATVALDSLSDGWFSYYVFRVRGGIVWGSIHWAGLISFWTRDLAAPLGIAMALGLLYVLQRLPRWRGEVEGVQLALLGGMILGSWACRLEPCVFVNGNIPAHAALAILAGLGLAEAPRPSAAGAPRGQVLAATALGFAVLLQFAGLGYQPADALPRPGDRRAGEEFVARLRATGARVFVPQHPYLLERAGLPTHAHAGCMDDVVRGDASGWGRSLTAAMDRAVRERRYAVAVLDNGWLRTEVERGYVLAGHVFADPRRFRTVSGTRVGPSAVYVPRPPGPAPAAVATGPGPAGRLIGCE